MMKKRTLAILLAATMLSTMAASCGAQGEKPAESKADDAASTAEGAKTEDKADPFGKYEETVVIRVGSVVDANTVFPEGETAEDNRYTRLVKEKLNIELETLWQVGSTPDFTQKMNLSIAANDLPDATVVNKVQFRTMAKSKQLEDMGSVIENYASDTMKAYLDTTDGEAIAASTYDDQVLGLPNIQADADGYHLLWVRKDWLDELKLDAPKSVDDVYNVAKAFVDNDMAGDGKTIGLSGPQSGGSLYANYLESSNNVYGFDPIFSAMGSYPGYWLQKEDGTVTYGSIEPETKTALETLQKMYKDGLIDPEMGVRTKSEEAVVSGQSGMFFGPWWMGFAPIPDAVRNDPEANWQAYAAPLNGDGEWTPHVAATTGMFSVVRKGYEHPEAIVKLANLAIVAEPTMDTADLSFNFFPMRNVQNTTDEVQVTTQILRDYLADKITPEDVKDEMEIYVGLKVDIETAKTAKKEPYDNMDIQNWNTADANFPRLYSMLVGASPLIDTEAKKVKSVVYEQTDSMQKRWSTLDKMEDETFLKIVTGASDISEFDAFVSQWKQQGGDDMLKELAEVTK